MRWPLNYQGFPPEAVVVELAVTWHRDHAAPRKIRRVEKLRRSRKPDLRREKDA